MTTQNIDDDIIITSDTRPTHTASDDQLVNMLAETRQQVNNLNHVVEALEARVRARGTGDLTEQAAQAVAQTTPIPEPQEPPRRRRRSTSPPASDTSAPGGIPAWAADRTARIPRQAVVTVPSEPSAVPLPVRVEAALRQSSMTLSKICRVTNSSVGPVTDVLRTMRKEGKIYNVGSAEYPMWTWRIGDNTDTATLTQTIRRLISERPMTTRELVDATGARITRVSGVMVQILRGPGTVLNMSHSRFGRWFLVPDDAKPARLVDPRKS